VTFQLKQWWRGLWGRKGPSGSSPPLTQTRSVPGQSQGQIKENQSPSPQGSLQGLDPTSPSSLKDRLYWCCFQNLETSEFSGVVIHRAIDGAAACRWAIQSKLVRDQRATFEAIPPDREGNFPVKLQDRLLSYDEVVRNFSHLNLVEKRSGLTMRVDKL
jgi:hypothetical protein